ncbi:hypothetical protein WG66_012849 [Moniliophthora roreri]|uniref:Uncharacterized protein n=1 Tax=Moniliophthora roreri TaxID=221103 RepID=A0A0W0GBT4_MONRR|nr:hypothetical protein WG66_012849 [Moniliophthora roreri]
MSDSFRKVIAETEERHSELLKAIKEVEHAPDALVAQRRRVAELQVQVEESVSKAEKQAEKPRKEKRSTSSPFKLPFLLKRTNSKGKEKELDIPSPYVESTQEEEKERQRQAEIDRSLREAQGQRACLEDKVKEYEHLRSKLEALYDLIFNGPTPGFPAEDHLEQQVAAARVIQERVQATLDAEKRAFECIYKAEKAMRECRSKIKDALQFAATSLFASGRSAQEREASAIHSAHILARQVPVLIREARQLSPDVKPIEDMTLVREAPSRADTPDGDAFYGKLKTIASEVSRVHTQLSEERQTAITRVSAARTTVENAESTVDHYRKELATLRQTIYEEVAEKVREQMREQRYSTGEEYFIDAPPSYEYEAPSMFVQTLTPSPLVIPNKHFGQFTDSSSPVSSSSQSTFNWNSSPASTVNTRRPRPLPRPPGT